MLELYLRPAFQRYFVKPVANRLIKRKTLHNPMSITLLSGVFGILCCISLWFKFSLIAILFLLLSGYADMLDGTLARQQKEDSAIGAICDIMMDRVVEILVILGLFLYFEGHHSWVFLLMMSSNLLCITSFLLVGIFTKNNVQKSFYYSPGFMERAEAFLFYIAIILLPNYLRLLAISYCLLVVYTAIYRLYHFQYDFSH